MKSDTAKQIKAPTKNPINSTTVAKNMTDWPGAFGIYQISKAAMMKNFNTFIRLAIIFGLFYAFDVVVTGTAKHHAVAHLIETVIFEFIAAFLSAVIILATIRSVRGEEISVGDSFSAVSDRALNIITTSIFTGVLILASIVLFIIPAFFVIPRIYLSLYFVVDKNMSPIDAIKASWDATEGHVSKVYGILGVNILIILPIITLIGVLATVYFGFMYYAASAVLYIFITNNQKAKPVLS